MYNFSYEKADSVDEAVKIMKGAEDGKFLAGGQTMLPTMKHRLAGPSALIDLGGIKELRSVSSDDSSVTIGAVSYTHLTLPTKA